MSLPAVSLSLFPVGRVKPVKDNNGLTSLDWTVYCIVIVEAFCKSALAISGTEIIVLPSPTWATPSVRVRFSENVNLKLITLSIPKMPFFALPSTGSIDSTLEIVGSVVSMNNFVEAILIIVLFPAISTTSAFKLIVLSSSYSVWANTCAFVIELVITPLAILFEGSTETGSPNCS